MRSFARWLCPRQYPRTWAGVRTTEIYRHNQSSRRPTSMAILISNLVHGILFAGPDDYLGSQMSSLSDRLLNGFDYLIGAICIHSQQTCQPIGITCPDQSH